MTSTKPSDGKLTTPRIFSVVFLLLTLLTGRELWRGM